MAKKKKNSNNNNNNGHDNSNEVENKNEEQVNNKKGGGGGGDKKEGGKANNGPLTVVFKVGIDCDGCASKLIKFAQNLDGVENATADVESNKLTLIGKVDPFKIQEDLHHKFNKRFDLVSPQPKKEEPNNAKNKDNNNKKPASDKKPESSDKKTNEPPVTTAVLKLSFHCHGCMERIHRTVSKTKGVQEMAFDKQKETVTVKGTMDAKAVAEALKERLKRPVDIVPPKKEKEKEKEGGGEKQGGDNGGGKNKKSDGDNGAGEGARMGGNTKEFIMQPGFGPGFGYVGQPFGNGYMDQPVYVNGYPGQPPPQLQSMPAAYGYGPGQDYGSGYGYGYVPGYPVHMKFNDENPNACSIL